MLVSSIMMASAFELFSLELISFAVSSVVPGQKIIPKTFIRSHIMVTPHLTSLTYVVDMKWL